MTLEDLATQLLAELAAWRALFSTVAETARSGPPPPADDRLKGDGLLRVAEVQEVLGLSRSGVYALLERGELKATKLGRAVRVTRASVRDFVSRCRV